MAFVPAMDSTATPNNIAPMTMQHDYYIKASSVRLPFLAAGLVNSAVALLLHQLSNRFFELALAEVPSQTQQAVTQPPPHCDPDMVLRPAENLNREIKSNIIAKVPNTPSEGTATISDMPANPQPRTSSPVELMRVKEELDEEFSAFIESMSAQANSHPQRSSQIESQFSVCPENTDVQCPNVSRVATLTYLKRYSCEYRNCGKVFFSRSSLFYHKQSHNSEKPYICSHSGCSMRFVSESLLQAHNQLHEQNPSVCARNQFCCNYPSCNKVFICQDRLIEHIRVHTGERPYVCDHPGCSYRFARRGNLFAHKRVHVDKTQRRQYHCVHPGCGKTFLYTRSLTEHMNVHMGERPYRCDYPNCDKSFTSKSYLHAHRRIHMGSNGNTNYNRTDPPDTYSLAPFPVTVTVPVPPPGTQQASLPFVQVPQSNEFPMYPFYPAHPS
ncbi:hypothetical protein CSKR_109659 [Clonorchis sinensis]|uniref:Uncharacterized protein n=2 Tax=Clonorchis sinensis TaxID=79923 RepID=A0A8T1MHS7_CLOSI|nr:hypothetical protein CSKR_109659 [Clonorchis sinensis]GAA31660.1 zinc finger protein 143 [Clonorchis sinensis]